MVDPCEHGVMGGAEFCVLCLRRIVDVAELRAQRLEADLLLAVERIESRGGRHFTADLEDMRARRIAANEAAERRIVALHRRAQEAESIAHRALSIGLYEASLARAWHAREMP